MSSFKLRPRFKSYSDLSIDEIKSRIKFAIDNHEKITGSLADSFIILKPKSEFSHYWSPQLTMMLEEEDGKTIIRGLYGPKQSVWLMFAFLYGVLAMVSIIITIWAAVEQYLIKETTLWYYLPIPFIIAFVIYLIAQFGQKLGAEQMFLLHYFISDIITLDISLK